MNNIRAILVATIVLAAAVYGQLPPVPTNVIAQAAPGTTIEILLTWQAPAGVWSFNVYRSPVDSLHFSRIAQVPHHSFEDRGLVPGRRYFYYVKSVVWADTGLVESGRSAIVAAPAGSPPGVRGRIRGTLTDDSSGVALRNVRVRFFRPNANWSDVYDVTDSLGFYEAELDSGRYLVKAEPQQENTIPRYRPEWYDNVPEPSAATSIQVGNGTVFTADFGLGRGGGTRRSEIEGTVSNELGQPLPGARVAIMRSIQEMNHLAATTGNIPGLGAEQRTLPGIGYTRGVIADTASDAQGRFHFEVPSGGSYIVAAGRNGYNTQYFSRTADPTQATIIVAGNDTSGVNFFLRPYSSSPNTLNGVIRDSNAVTVPSRVILFPRPPGGAPPSQVAHSNSDGAYEFIHVLPGTYSVLAIPFSNYAVGFYKQGQYGVSQWVIADSVVAGNSVSGIDVGVVQVQSGGLTQVSGTSISSQGELLAGGRIVVKNAAGEVLGDGISTASGGYIVDALPAGQVTFVVDKEPYASQEFPVTIPPNTYSITNVNIVFTAPTGAPEGKQHVPDAFALEQNYPNPFNPLTLIAYTVPARTSITLRVFDILGREVATLANAEQEAGRHVVRFEASKFASGVYYYRLDAGGNTVVKKMLLMR